MEIKVGKVSPQIQMLRQKTPISDKNVQLRSKCSEFEAIFVNQMLKGMRSTVPQDGFLPTSSGEEAFRDLMDAEISKQMATTGNIGIGESLFRQLTKD